MEKPLTDTDTTTLLTSLNTPLTEESSFCIKKTKTNTVTETSDIFSHINPGGVVKQDIQLQELELRTTPNDGSCLPEVLDTFSSFSLSEFSAFDIHTHTHSPREEEAADEVQDDPRWTEICAWRATHPHPRSVTYWQEVVLRPIQSRNHGMTCTSTHNYSNDDEETNEVTLWSREESTMLCIPLLYSDTNIMVMPTLLTTPRTEQDPTSFIPPALTLKQYTTKDELWGIHSTVWDGGLATLTYLCEKLQCLQDPIMNKVTMIELGAGTGVVGIGVAMLGPHKVYLTDVIEALPLLEENVSLNTNKVNDKGSIKGSCQILELIWGNHFLPHELIDLLDDTSIPNILIVGADIIYQQNLFLPLLTTLRQLFVLSRRPELERIECVLGAHSMRTHLQDFEKMAKKEGFEMELLASAIFNMNLEHQENEEEGGKHKPWKVTLPHLKKSMGRAIEERERGWNVVNIFSISVRESEVSSF